MAKARLKDRMALSQLLPKATDGLPNHWTRPPPLTELLLVSPNSQPEERLVAWMERCLERECARTPAPWSAARAVDYLGAPRAVDGRAPLHVAAELGMCRFVQRIAWGGVRVDLPDHQGLTALMVAASVGRVEAVALLLQAGAAVGAADGAGRRPLHHAVQPREGALEVARALLGARADVNARDGQGTTPLMLAASLRLPEMTAVLLAAGAAAVVFGGDGRTPLEHARSSRRCPSPRSLRSPGRGPASAGVPPTATRLYQRCRWDGTGEGDVGGALLRAERDLRRVGAEPAEEDRLRRGWSGRRRGPGLPVAERDRLHAALPLLH